MTIVFTGMVMAFLFLSEVAKSAGWKLIWGVMPWVLAICVVITLTSKKLRQRAGLFSRFPF